MGATVGDDEPSFWRKSLNAMSLKELRAELTSHGMSADGMLEKSDLFAACARARRERGTPTLEEVSRQNNYQPVRRGGDPSAAGNGARDSVRSKSVPSGGRPRPPAARDGIYDQQGGDGERQRPPGGGRAARRARAQADRRRPRRRPRVLAREPAAARWRGRRPPRRGSKSSSRNSFSSGADPDNLQEMTVLSAPLGVPMGNFGADVQNPNAQMGELLRQMQQLEQSLTQGGGAQSCDGRRTPGPGGPEGQGFSRKGSKGGAAGGPGSEGRRTPRRASNASVNAAFANIRESRKLSMGSNKSGSGSDGNGNGNSHHGAGGGGANSDLNASDPSVNLGGSGRGKRRPSGSHVSVAGTAAGAAAATAQSSPAADGGGAGADPEVPDDKTPETVDTDGAPEEVKATKRGFSRKSVCCIAVFLTLVASAALAAALIYAFVIDQNPAKDDARVQGGVDGAGADDAASSTDPTAPTASPVKPAEEKHDDTFFCKEEFP